MEFFDKVAQAITSLDKKNFHYYLAGALGVTVLASGGIIYGIYTSRQGYHETITALYDQAKLDNKIISNYEKIHAEEERIQLLLSDNKGFSIKSYFEQFCSEHSVTPEQGWDTETRSIDGNEQFEEVLLPATFRAQTTQNLVTILNSLDANEIVYIKDLDIKTEDNNTISFNLTIATKKHKRFWDE